MRLTCKGDSWRFCPARAPASLLDPVQEITPFIVPSEYPDELSVCTHIESFPGPVRKTPPAGAIFSGGTPFTDAPLVRVDVMAAGGRIVGTAEAMRGKVVHFIIRDWPDGAYELRCSTETAWGRPWVTYLPWYKGDALVAARKFHAAAEVAGRDPIGGTSGYSPISCASERVVHWPLPPRISGRESTPRSWSMKNSNSGAPEAPDLCTAADFYGWLTSILSTEAPSSAAFICRLTMIRCGGGR